MFPATVPAMWDDGEFYNGVDKYGPPARLAAGRQAWFENMPLVDPGESRMYRSLAWGDLADIPVVVISADGKLGEKTEAMGVIGLLKKPVDIQELVNTVRSSLH